MLNCQVARLATDVGPGRLMTVATSCSCPTTDLGTPLSDQRCSAGPH